MRTTETKLRTGAIEIWAITIALLAFALVNLTACGGSGHADAASAASQNFMKAYYQNSSPNSALEFCTGEAKTKVDKEVAAIAKSGDSSDNASEKPAVTLKYDAYKEVSAQEYLVTWNVRSSAGQTLKVTTTMVKPNDRWLVTKFVESQS